MFRCSASISLRPWATRVCLSSLWSLVFFLTVRLRATKFGTVIGLHQGSGGGGQVSRSAHATSPRSGQLGTIFFLETTGLFNAQNLSNSTLRLCAAGGRLLRRRSQLIFFHYDYETIRPPFDCITLRPCCDHSRTALRSQAYIPFCAAAARRV